ncbi:hypothetical protein DMUE_2155 [Dictyocoela muelleri]|nr:hypothetical protein DMUE_2155 [Dictyocoela muelleri]
MVDRTAAQVLKSSISTNYFWYIIGCNNTSEIIQTLFKMKYLSKNHVKYLNQLSNIKQNNYFRISEYKKEIENVIRKLSVCLNWNEEMRIIKGIESFYYGHLKRTQLEMTR